MPEISAKVIKDSISLQNHRMVSIQVSCHRLILAEINTHRVKSRSYRSSRAVPSKKLIDEVRTDPAMPVYWGRDMPGMQAPEELELHDRGIVEQLWRDSARCAADYAEDLAKRSLHKQTANRILEPYMFTHGIVSATEWENMVALRVSPDAQPEFNKLAQLILIALRESEPKILMPGQWHLPYVDDDDYDELTELWVDACKNPTIENINPEALVLDYAKSISSARCARASYKVFDADRKSRLDEDVRLTEKLIKQGHWGPFEHQATPDETVPRHARIGIDPPEVVHWLDKHVNWMRPDLHGNLVGWMQNRKFYLGENRTFDIRA